MNRLFGFMRQQYTLSILLLVLLSSMPVGAAEDAADFKFERIEPATLNKHPFYSQATTVEGDAKFVYVAGQTDRPVSYTYGSNACRHDDWFGQYLGVHENVEKALTASGATWDDVVFIRRFVTDIKKFRSVMSNPENKAPKYFKNRRPPPSTLIEVSALSEPCQLIEIDVFAVVPATD